MNWKVIKTEREHKRAVKRAMEIFHAAPGTPEDDELGVLLLLIKGDEDRIIPTFLIAVFSAPTAKPIFHSAGLSKSQTLSAHRNNREECG
jgi:hypothetical protein